MKNATSISIIRWMARIIGTLMVAFTLIIFIGETLESYNKHDAAAFDTFDTLMIITFIFLGVGLAGLILALWKEGLGGIVSLVSLIIFIFLVDTNPKINVSVSIAVIILLIPSILYLCYWWLTRKSSNKIS